MNWRWLSVTGAMLVLYVLCALEGCGAISKGIHELYERVNGSSVPVSEDANVGSYGQEPQRDSYMESYFEVAGAILVGVSSAFWSFRRLQGTVGDRGRNVCLIVLVFSFVMCAYGFGLLLELAAGG
jgi:hypothetical protein